MRIDKNWIEKSILVSLKIFFFLNVHLCPETVEKPAIPAITAITAFINSIKNFTAIRLFGYYKQGSFQNLIPMNYLI